MAHRSDDASRCEDTLEREKTREGLRRSIADALKLEIDRTNAGTVARLLAAGGLGTVGAVGSLAIFAGRLLETGRSWHLATCAAAWSGLLVACFAVVLLRIRSERIPLDQACRVALAGLVLATILGLLCPDVHYLAWWGSTRVGDATLRLGGAGAAAFCLGACSALLVGSAATALLALRGISPGGAMLPGLLLFLLLWPAVVLQSVEEPPSVFAWWSAGLFAGSWAGIALGLQPARGCFGRAP